MFFKKTSSFFHEISISFSYSSSILRNVLKRNKREPNELQTSSFFTSFISLNVPHRVDSRALLPHSVYAEPKIGNSSFLPILPLFFTLLSSAGCGGPRPLFVGLCRPNFCAAGGVLLWLVQNKHSTRSANEGSDAMLIFVIMGGQWMDGFFDEPSVRAVNSPPPSCYKDSIEQVAPAMLRARHEPI